MGGFAPQKYEHFALFDEESEKMQGAFLSLSRSYFMLLRSVAQLFLILSKRFPEHLARRANAKDPHL